MIVGTSLDDRNLVGTSGNDVIRGLAGNDRLFGLAGNDTLDGGAGDDYVDGDDGDDTLVGGDGNDRLVGGNGNDTLDGGEGNDTLAAGNGRDVLRGGAGNDILAARDSSMQDDSSDDGANQMFGDDGDDDLFGGNGNDTLDGGAGDDYVEGDDGDDTLVGGDGNDRLVGENGNDTLDGGAGNDTLEGENGNDTLDGGLGADMLYGGAGNDHYIVDHLSDYVNDNQGSNTGLIKVDFYKKSANVNWQFADGVKKLPYWIDTLVGDNTEYIDAQQSLAAGVIKYAFPNLPLSAWDDGDRLGFTPFNAAQKAFVQKIFAYIETIINIKFELVSDASQAGVLTFANNQQIEKQGGYATGGLSFSKWGVFLNNIGSSADGNAAPREGEFAAYLFMHEIGHALGLKHPHDGEAGEGVPANPPYLEKPEDISTFTQLSYTHKKEDYFSVFRDLDIAALQYLYGPAKVSGTAKNQTGNNTYTLSDTKLNFIWDGGGTDTLDAQSSRTRLTLSLEAGGHSFFGNSAASLITSAGQVTINFGTVIENAFGTAFDDVIEGNAAGNYLLGLAGNDRLSGGAGSDRLEGGLGSDTLDGGEGRDTIYYDFDPIQSGVRIDMRTNQVTGTSGIDTLISIERVWGSVFDDVFIGSDAADYFIGDKGNDIAEGGLGSDTFQINNDFSDCIVKFEGDICVIVSKDLGTDRLSNFEFINFVGLNTVSKTVAELKTSSALLPADTAAPTVTSFSPADGTTNVALGSNLVIAFNETIRLGTGTIEIRSGSATGAVVESFNAANSTRLAVSGGALTIDPTSNLAAGTQYFVVLPSGVIRDAAGNAYAGTSTYDFTTGAADTTAPTVSTVSPADGATNVSASSNIILTFSEAVEKGTGTIEIRSGSATGPVVESFSAATSSLLTVSGSTLTIDPTNNLAAGTQYFVVLPSGAIRDIAGNAYAGTSTYDFTIAGANVADDFPNSSVTTGIVTIGGAAVSGSIETANDRDWFRVALTAGTTYKFNLNLSSGSLDPFLRLLNESGSQIKDNDDFAPPSLNSQITFTATSSGTYYLEAKGFDAGTGSYSLQAFVVDTTAPTVSTVSPADGATNVAASSNIILTFSEAVEKGTGTIEIRSGSATGPVVESFNAATSSRLIVSGSTLTIDPTNNLAAGTQYFVVLPSGAIRDIAGNAYAGTSTYDFTTVATPAGPVSSFRLITADGWSGAIGGSGTIFGSAGVQDIRLLSGSVVLDPSFNRGGDVVRLAGTANAYSTALVGSAAQISTASGLNATIPIGLNGLFMSFDDGARKLAFANGSVRIGTQTLVGATTPISSAAGTDPLPAGIDPAASARLVLSGGTLNPGETAHVTFGGRGTIFGSSGADIVAIASGQRTNATFDPSFNRGGDVIVLPNQASSYTAALVGSSAVVLIGADQSLNIPVGISGLILRFADAERNLLFTGGAVKIGDQTIGATATSLTPATVQASASIDNGTTSTTLSAANGNFNFTDDATKETNVVIASFTSGDRISVTGARSSDYAFTTSDNGRDLIISFNNLQAQVVNSIVLDDVLVGRSGLIVDFQSAVQAVGYNFMVFG
jgi:Ca2+-binding RTX toxin-like protein/methionine-rich copper-binding protein CopC